MDQSIKELIEISRFYGANEEYVIAGGGNTSFKNEEFLWIKASGVALADISENGFVKLSREKLRIISQREYSTDSTQREAEVKEDLLNAVVLKNGLRPSVETSLHEIVKYPFVIHTHPTLVNALLCSNQAKEKSFELLGNEIMFLPYIDPGYVLFKEVEDTLKDYRNKNGSDPKIILLENHGIIVSGNSAEEVKTIYSDVENKILKASDIKLPSLIISRLDHELIDILKGIYFNKSTYINFISNELIMEFVKDKASFNEIATAFTPDHIVYCKARYLFVEEDKSEHVTVEIADFIEKFGYFPKVIGVKGRGLIIADENDEAFFTIRDLILNMMKISFYGRAFGGSKPMTDKQIEFIENWEVENYRKKMAEKK